MDQDNLNRVREHYQALADEAVGCIFAFPDGDVLVIVPEAERLTPRPVPSITTEQQLAEQDAEYVAAMRAQPCNGDRCRWFGSFADGFGDGR